MEKLDDGYVIEIDLQLDGTEKSDVFINDFVNPERMIYYSSSSTIIMEATKAEIMSFLGNKRVKTIYSHNCFMFEDGGMDPAVADMVRNDYTAYYNSLIPDYPNSWLKPHNIGIYIYFGSYSGCEVFYLLTGMTVNWGERYVDIAGYTLYFGSSQEVYVYNNSEFYTVKEAYDEGLIEKSDVYDFGIKLNGKGFFENNKR